MVFFDREAASPRRLVSLACVGSPPEFFFSKNGDSLPSSSLAGGCGGSHCEAAPPSASLHNPYSTKSNRRFLSPLRFSSGGSGSSSSSSSQSSSSSSSLVPSSVLLVFVDIRILYVGSIAVAQKGEERELGPLPKAMSWSSSVRVVCVRRSIPASSLLIPS